MSNFEDVVLWNKLAGVETHPTPRFPSERSIDLGLELIDEEFEELIGAIQDKNLTEVADAIGDLLYVVYGLAHRFGMDADGIFDIIHTSNMSKFCSTMAEADETVEWYRKKGVTAYIEHIEDRYIVRRDDNKILKSVSWVEPDIIGVLNDQTDKANQSNTDKEMGQTI